jgi:propanol-preferring alcohol dehydrogenase
MGPGTEWMQAWEVRTPGPIDSGPLALVRHAVPEPGPREVRVAVTACGVCRTDLHLAEGDLPPRRPGTVPGHEIVGLVDALGPGAGRFELGARVGIPWLRHTCGTCRFCRRGDENLCLDPRFTGWDADGGYAQFAVVQEDYAYDIPAVFDDEHAAPLLCAGIIGYRALRRAQLPRHGRLGIYGFGGSAHIAAQVALAEGATVHVVTRSERARALALDLGAHSARPPSQSPPEPLDAALLFAPTGELVPAALAALDRGGTLSIAGVHLSDLPSLRHSDLFYEKRILTVTANTRGDGHEFLELAARLGLRISVTPFNLSDADRALRSLAHQQVTGAAVLRPAEL